MEWVDVYGSLCPGCTAMYKGRNPPEEPPCSTCRVELLEENEEAAQVFMATRGQVITVGERVVDLSIPAVKIIMDLHGIKDQRECLNAVMSTFHHLLKQQGGGDEG